MFCTRCGARNDDAHRFCMRCGTALAVATATPPAPPPPRPPLSTGPIVASTPFPPATPAAPRLRGPLVGAGASAYGAPLARLVAAAVDALAVWVLAGGAGAVLGVEEPFTWTLLFGAVLWLYFASGESSAWQGTPGKRMMELRVVDAAGDGLTFGEASRRFAGKTLATLLFGVGLAMILFDDEHRGMHDGLADSWVVRD